MRYLIVSDSYAPFYSTYFDAENHFNKDDNMVVFNLTNHLYTTDGKHWFDIPEDHL